MSDDNAEDDLREKLSQVSVELEKSYHSRLDSVIDVFEQLIIANITSPNLERLLSVLIRLYGLFTTVAKTITVSTSKKTKSSISNEFKTLCESIASKLTEQTYKLINHINEGGSDDTETEGKKKKGSKAKIGKELKLIPDLIFNIEQFELCLIKVSKETGYNLVKNMKRSQIREFRVDAALLDNPEIPMEETEEKEETEKPKKKSPASKRKSKTPPKKTSATTKKTSKRKKEVEEAMQADEDEPKKKKGRKSK
jgi:hypothetical protein